jgi:hypothetical protein
MKVEDLTVHHHLLLALLLQGTGTHFPCVDGEIDVVEGPVEFFTGFGFVGGVVVGGEVFVAEGLFGVDAGARVEDEHLFQ